MNFPDIPMWGLHLNDLHIKLTDQVPLMDIVVPTQDPNNPFLFEVRAVDHILPSNLAAVGQVDDDHSQGCKLKKR